MAIQAFYTGISGIQNSSVGIDVLANNIANINTVGYRGSTTEFASMFENAISTGTISGGSIGAGVRVQTTSMIREQGPLIASDRSTDLAILGEGWFAISGEGDSLYTRNGSFGFDSNNNLVTKDGFNVANINVPHFDNTILTHSLRWCFQVVHKLFTTFSSTPC